MNILSVSSILALSSILLSTTNVYAQTVDKIQLINAVFEDTSINCNLPIGKYSDQTVQTSLEICKKGMAWLKVECDLHYDNVPLCKENMSNIKKFLGTNYFDERDTQYHHDEYNKRIDMNLDIDTMTVIQEKKIPKGLQLLLDAVENMPPLNLTQIEEQEKQKEAERQAQEKRSQETIKELQREIFGNSCKPISGSIPLQNKISPHSIIILGNYANCKLKEGIITINIPDKDDLKFVVLNIDHDLSSNSKGVIIEMNQTNGESAKSNKISKVILNKEMSGTDAQTGKPSKISEINGFALYNVGKRYISFNQNNVNVSISFQ